MWIVTGPAGCGKTTVAMNLSKDLDIPYIEGDEFHTAANRQKMSNGIPLTDADRWDWLINLREAAALSLAPSSTHPHTGVVVTCSALKKKYRDVIRVAAYKDHDVLVHFIYLVASEAELLRRVGGRVGHYMKDSMVHSQMEVLEPPDREERGLDVIEVSCEATPPQVQSAVLLKVREVLEADGRS